MVQTNRPGRGVRRAAAEHRLGLGFGFAQTGHPVARLPLAALLEQRHALESFQDIAFGAQGGGGPQTAML